MAFEWPLLVDARRFSFISLALSFPECLFVCVFRLPCLHALFLSSQACCNLTRTILMLRHQPEPPSHVHTHHFPVKH